MQEILSAARAVPRTSLGSLRHSPPQELHPGRVHSLPWGGNAALPKLLWDFLLLRTLAYTTTSITVQTPMRAETQNKLHNLMNYHSRTTSEYIQP